MSLLHLSYLYCQGLNGLFVYNKFKTEIDGIVDPLKTQIIGLGEKVNGVLKNTIPKYSDLKK